MLVYALAKLVISSAAEFICAESARTSGVSIPVKVAMTDLNSARPLQGPAKPRGPRPSKGHRKRFPPPTVPEYQHRSLPPGAEREFGQLDVEIASAIEEPADSIVWAGLSPVAIAYSARPRSPHTLPIAVLAGCTTPL